MNSKKNFPEFPGISEGCRDWIDCLIHDRNIKIQSALHGGGEKKIGFYKVDGFCQELNTVFEFYGDYWHAHPDLVPDENAQHPARKHDDKDNTPFTVKEIRDYDRQRLQHIYRTRATMLKSSWRVIGIHLLKVVLKSKPTFHNFAPSLTLKRLSAKTKLFNILKMVTCLDSSNVTFTHLNISKITFQK